MGSPDTTYTIPGAGSSFLTDLVAFLGLEDAARYAELFSSCVVSGGTHGTGASLTGTPSSLIAYPSGVRITETGSITYTNNVTTWVVAHKDTTSAVATWTRVSGTHYLIKETGTTQTAPTDCVLLMKVVTSGGSITEVTDLRVTSPVYDALQEVVTTSGGIYNLISNGQFAFWTGGVSSAPDDWTLAGAGASVAKETTNFYSGSAAAAITRSGTDCTLTQDFTGRAGSTTYVQGRTFSAQAAVRSGTANSVRIQLDDGVATAESDYHSGSDTFELLTVNITADSAATQIHLVLRVESSNHTAEFDSAIAVEGSAIHPWSPNVNDLLRNNFTATSDPTVNDDATFGYLVGSRWLDTTTNRYFVCLDNTDGAAVWRLAIGGLVEIDSVTASSSSAADLDFSSLFDHFLVIASGVVLESDTSIYVRFSDDNGATFEADAADYRYVAIGYAGDSGDSADASIAAVGDGGAGGTGIQLNAISLGLATDEGFSAFLSVHYPYDTTVRTRVLSHIGGGGTGGSELVCVGSGRIAAAAANQAIRFIPGADTIVSGRFTVFGLLGDL